jgi:pimeloyl-ACP methyl ester carboxylesterase
MRSSNASPRLLLSRIQGQAVKAGHFFPEENPNETAELLINFLAA